MPLSLHAKSQSTEPAKGRFTSEERRTSIVQAAMRLFAEKGFRGTTTRELAAAVGVTEPVLYEHFKTKSELYSAMIETASVEGLRQVNALLQRHSQIEDDAGLFEALAGMICEWHRDSPELPRLLLFSSLENHDLKYRFHERLGNPVVERLSRYIQLRIDAGSMRPVHPGIAAVGFLNMIVHFAMNTILFGHESRIATEEVMVRELVRIYLGGLCAPNKANRRTALLKADAVRSSRSKRNKK